MSFVKKFKPEDLGEMLRYRKDKAVSGQACFPVSFLIGAGFSQSANIPLAAELIRELRGMANAGHPQLAKALKAERPSNVSEYNYLMEHLGGAKDRADFIKAQVEKGRDPGTGLMRINWAHLLLALLVEHKYVNLILTTNFDPIIPEALSFLAQPVRVFDLNSCSGYQPGILDSGSIAFLHGQMHSLFLANDPSELQRVSQHYTPIFHDAVRDSVLIVVGYSGSCDPVVETMLNLTGYPRNLYWCSFDDAVEDAPKKLAEKLPGQLYFCGGYRADDFMRELVQDGMGLDIPHVFRDPLAALEKSFGRVADFPNTSDTQGTEPLSAAKQVVKTAQNLLAQSENLNNGVQPDTKTILELGASIFRGDEVELEKIAAQITPNPSDKLSQEIGNAFLSLAGRDLRKGKWDSARISVGKARKWGVPEEKIGWLCVTEGGVLVRQAKAVEDPLERNQLFQSAMQKYAEAVQIKADMHEAYYNWGNALSNQAKLTSDLKERDRLFSEAVERYMEAVEIKPDKHEAYYNWGNALSDRAQLTSDEKARDRLFLQACEKFAEAVRIKPDKHEAFSNWAITLGDQAKLTSDVEARNRLFLQAYEKFAEALRIKPDKHEDFNNWATTLGDQAKLTSDVEARDRLFLQASEKFAEAVQIKPDDVDLYCNWGVILSEQAKLSPHVEARDQLFLQASEKFAEAIRIRPGNADIYFNWGTALSEQAKFTLDIKEQNQLFLQAREKFAQSIQIKPEDADTYCNWSATLSEQAKRTTVAEIRYQLFTDARAKLLIAIDLNPPLAIFELARLEALLGDTQGALNALKRWKSLVPAASQYDLLDKDFALIKEDPQFLAIRESLPIE